MVLFDVCIAGITSTRGIKFAGLKKCKPINLLFISIELARAVIDNEDVFVAIIHSLFTIFSNLEKTSFLISKSSIIASIISSELERSLISEVNFILFFILKTSSFEYLFLLSNLFTSCNKFSSAFFNVFFELS